MGVNIDECTQTVRAQKWTDILRDRQSSGQSTESTSKHFTTIYN